MSSIRCSHDWYRLDNDTVPAKKIAILTIWIKQGFGGMGNPTSTEDTPNYIIHRVDDLIQLLRIYRMLV